MYYKDDIISYLQSNNILALKLDHAITGVRHAILDQINTIGSGARRALYYTSCFTEDYYDVCENQKNEDYRFTLGVLRLLQHEDIISEMLRIYFQEIFRYKTNDQLQHIKALLMNVNIHIASSSLTVTGFALATASAAAAGMNMNIELSASVGGRASGIISGIGIYGIIQKAANSANRLKFTNPVYYSALYSQDLEMMYFLIEPLFERFNGTREQCISDPEVADIISGMIR
ncbi:MAG: hypothetical protein E7J63_19975 [Pantoea sp.]|uniref:hypothetical protein n=1 Tax=Pantoea sp. TaxID=69393 RepID=UPI00290A6788|nr:hypothetical protein [Pantoea sp.]MDU6093139.1 hypothetical protein [Staphylococcus lugdunensis]MDU7840559.1 hypothetical protein [Pantoea sp.]